MTRIYLNGNGNGNGINVISKENILRAQASIALACTTQQHIHSITSITETKRKRRKKKNILLSLVWQQLVYDFVPYYSKSCNAIRWRLQCHQIHMLVCIEISVVLYLLVVAFDVKTLLNFTIIAALSSVGIGKLESIFRSFVWSIQSNFLHLWKFWLPLLLADKIHNH